MEKKPKFIRTHQSGKKKPPKKLPVESVFVISKSKIKTFALTIGWKDGDAAKFIQQWMDDYVDGRIARAERRFVPGTDKFKGIDEDEVTFPKPDEL